MKTLLFLVLIAVATGNFASTKDDSDSQALISLIENSEVFHKNIIKILARKQPEKNLAVFTINISKLLGMLANGAKGNTSKEIKKAMNLSNDDETMRAGFQNLDQFLSSSISDDVISFGKMFLVKRDLSLDAQFKAVSDNHFNATAESVDFIHPIKSDGIVISQSSETNHDDDVNHSSAFVVFDAVMSTTLAWIESFNPSTTKNLPFYVDNDTIKQVPTMYTEGKYNWGRVAKLNASFIELPLEGNNLSRIFIVPNKVGDLPALIKGLAKIKIDEILRQGSTQEVKVLLPKFGFRRYLDLKSTLEELGIHQLFTNNADLSGIADAKMKVSKFGQTLSVRIGEKGVEPAVVTGSANLSTFHIDKGFVDITVIKKSATVQLSSNKSEHKVAILPLIAGFIYDPTET